MKRFLAFLLACLPAMAGALQGPYECQYGATCELPLELYEPDGVLPYSGTAPNAAADFFVHCPSANSESTTAVSGTSKNGTFGFAFVIQAADTDCDILKVTVRDADGPGTAYLSTAVGVETCGNASAAKAQCRENLSTLVAAEVQTASDAALRALRLEQLFFSPLATPVVGSFAGDLLQDSAGAPGTWQFTANALEQAPGGGGGSDVNVISWGGTLLATTNPLPNAAPGANGGLPTVNASSQLVQPASVYENTDKTGYSGTVAGYDAGVSFNANQVGQLETASTTSINAARLNELFVAALSAQPAAGSMLGDLTQDSTTIPGTQQFTADALAQAPAGTVDAEAVRNSLGGFGATVSTVTNQTTFVVSGPVAPTSAGDLINDEFFVVLKDATDNNAPACARQIQDFLAPTGQLQIKTACTHSVAVGDEVLFLPNGAGAPIADVSVTAGGEVNINLAQQVDGTTELGCMLAGIYAVQTGARTASVVVNDVTYTFRDPANAVDRVESTFNTQTQARAQATVVCP